MDTSQKKRMIVLGVVVAVVAAVGIPYIISHPNATSNVVTTTAKSTGDSVKQNKASANKKAKKNDAKVNNEKLELNKLTHDTSASMKDMLIAVSATMNLVYIVGTIGEKFGQESFV